jgi:putative transcriptional regulator
MLNHVKEERKKRKVSQSDLGEKVGVSRQTINSIERGRYQPSTVLALKIAKLFEIPVEALFELEDDD